MRRCTYSILAPLAVLALASVGSLPAGLAQADEAVPPIGGGYAGGKNVVAIPIDDPDVKAIAGALFKPAGAVRSRRSST